MPGVTQEQIAQAKSVNTLAFLLAHHPEDFRRVGQHEYRHRQHDSLKISDNGKWHWHSKGYGGTTAVQYLIRVEEMEFVRAVQIVCADAPYLSSPHVQDAVTSQKAQPFALLPRADDDVAYEYLAGRGICAEVLSFCFRTNRILGVRYQSKAGKEYNNCMFVGFDEAGQPAHASLRGIEGFFRGNLPGSDKRFSFCIPAEPAEDAEADTVAIYESPIDAMSEATLNAEKRGRHWRNQHYLALDGLSYLPIDQFLATHPKVKCLRICTDNDKAGRAHAECIAEKYAAQGYIMQNCIPCGAKDYNALLQKHLARKRGMER